MNNENIVIQSPETVTVSNKVIESSPSELRILQNADGSSVMQAGYKWATAEEKGIEWRDVPVVQA